MYMHNISVYLASYIYMHMYIYLCILYLFPLHSYMVVFFFFQPLESWIPLLLKNFWAENVPSYVLASIFHDLGK